MCIYVYLSCIPINTRIKGVFDCIWRIMGVFTAELQRGRIQRVFVVYQCVFACIQRILCNTRSIHVGYTSDTVFGTQSNVGPGLVNVSWVEYG